MLYSPLRVSLQAALRTFGSRPLALGTPGAGATAPGAPTIGVATAGDGQATFPFSAPASDGGAPITGYRLTVSPGGAQFTGASSPITATGLTNGVAYTGVVAAQNSAGFGANSAASNSVTPAAAGAYSGPTYVAGNFGMGSGTTSASRTPPLPAGVAVNDILIAVISTQAQGATPVIGQAGWASLASVVGAGARRILAWRYDGTDPAPTFTTTASGSSSTLMWVSYFAVRGVSSGAALASIIEGFVSAHSTGGTAGAQTVAHSANALALHSIHAFNTAASDPDAGWTEALDAGSGSYRGILDHAQRSAAGSITGSTRSANPDQRTTIGFAIKAS